MTENEEEAPGTPSQEVENEITPQEEWYELSEEEINPQPKKSITRLLPWLGVLALAGVIALFIWVYTTMTSISGKEPVPPVLKNSTTGGLKIAFVNSDSLKAHYQLVEDLQKKLEAKYSSLSNDMNSRQTALETKATDLQYQFDAKKISMEEAQRLDESLQIEGRKLLQLKQQYSDNMAAEEERLNMVYVDSINNFLKRLNKKYQFDYVLGYSKGGGILFARDTLDITPFVVEGLNNEYYKIYPDSKKKDK